MDKDFAQSLESLFEPGSGIKATFFDNQHRFTVTSNLGWNEEFKGTELNIVSVHEPTSKWKKLIMKDSWAHVVGPPDENALDGSHINIIGARSEEIKFEDEEIGIWIIDRSHGFLIIEPDSLISVTSVMGTFFCERKTIFTESARMPFDNIDAFRGVVAHEIIGRGMQLTKYQQSSLACLKQLMESVISSPGILIKAYGLGLNSTELHQLGTALVPFVLKFLTQRYIQHKKHKSREAGAAAAAGSSNTNRHLEIDKLIDIEDNFWNPMYGIKGKLDATIAVREVRTGLISIAPLEFKTGHEAAAANKNRDSHIGQVQLYSLLMSGRYEDVGWGILYYIREDNLMEIPIQRKLLQALLQARNRLALGLKSKDGQKLTGLPKPTIDYKFCQNCEFRTMCALDVVKNGTAEYKQNLTEATLTDSVSYLLPMEIKFYFHWFNIISQETLASEKKINTKSLWTETEDKREKSGRALAFLQIIHFGPETDRHERILGHTIDFKRLPNAPALNWERVDMREFDFVIIGSNTDLCITYGMIQRIDLKSGMVSVRIERMVNSFLPEDQQTGNPGSNWFTIDKIQSSSPISMQYGYLQGIMSNTSHAARCREYIIRGRQPEFPPINPQEIIKFNILPRFNNKQQSVITHSIRTDSYLLVQGMPGTGKTETISGLIELLTKMGASVLVVAYTGTGLDNILHKYSLIGNNFLRVGEPKLKFPDLVKMTTVQVQEQINDLDVMTDLFQETPVIGTTLLSLKHELFRRRTFDYLIVDEASQALPSAVFGAMMLAHKWIFFGDPQQLATVMTSGAAKGNDESIFTLLSTPQNTKILTTQYRMNGAIMKLANTLVYNGAMKCGPFNKNNIIGINQLKLLNQLTQANSRWETKKKWLSIAASTKPIKAVVFLDTNKLGELAYETKKEDSIANELEASIVLDLIQLFVENNIQTTEIGIIAPYRGQVSHIKNKLKELGEPYSDGSIEVNTVDQYQGRDKEIIICTFTKNKKTEQKEKSAKENEDPSSSSSSGSSGAGSSSDVPPNTEAEAPPSESDITNIPSNILSDIRRLNVAITRAKRKLILIGSSKYLVQLEPFAKLFSALEPEQIEKLTHYP